ncbi:MAG: SLC13 family permease [Acidobacteria bacterium]|nr:SLC13 family permease [Acidobacteriota bacterium]
MTFEIGFMLALIVVALILFVLELFPLEVTAMLMLAVLLAFGIVTVDEAILGLSNKAVVTVGAMLVLGHALVKTGVLAAAADRLANATGSRAWLTMGLVLVVASLLSGFLSNTAVVAIFIPLLIDLCRRFHLSPSKFMLPLSYVSIAGGTLTVIGTSTNLLVSAIAEENGLEPFGMFEFSALGIVLMFAGLMYVLVASPYLLPTRSTPEALTRQYEMRHYLTEVQVSATSKLVGKTIEESAINHDYDITVIAVHRGVDHVTENLRHLRIREEDVLVVRGSANGLTRFASAKGVAPLSDARLSDAKIFEEGQFLVEAIVGRNSRLIGRTLEEIDFRQRIGAFVLAIRRGGEILHDKIARTRLQFADDLLLVAPEDRLARLRHTEDLIITSRVEVSTTLGGANWAILVILPTVVILAALGVADILKGAIVGCILLLALRALRPNEAYRAVDWSLLFLIAAFVPVGMAMQTTGTAAFLAQGILRVQHLNPDFFTPVVILSVLYLLTSLLTQTISNNATAILMAPIAIQLAVDLGVDARPFLVAVAFAASAGLMTPYGYQTNLMVMGPGGYRFIDFVRFGGPLTIVFWLLATLLIPTIWSF